RGTCKSKAIRREPVSDPIGWMSRERPARINCPSRFRPTPATCSIAFPFRKPSASFPPFAAKGGISRRGVNLHSLVLGLVNAITHDKVHIELRGLFIMPETDEKNPVQPNGANILVVDDREEDVFFLRRAFEGVGLHHRLTHVTDGDEAIKYLSRQAPYDNNALHPVPDVVVLDLKMPRRDGFEVLQWLREQKTLKPAPVVVLTSSDRDEDKKRAKDLGAGSYYTKPVDFTKLVGVAKDINRRWLSQSRALGLLIVDDDENDRFLLRRAFEKLNVGYR